MLGTSLESWLCIPTAIFKGSLNLVTQLVQTWSEERSSEVIVELRFVDQIRHYLNCESCLLGTNSRGYMARSESCASISFYQGLKVIQLSSFSLFLINL